MKKKVLENIVKWIFLLCGIAAVGFVLCICLYLVISGVPAVSYTHLTLPTILRV